MTDLNGYRRFIASKGTAAESQSGTLLDSLA